MTSTYSPDILVVGLGAVGSAVLYQATKLGARAIGIDRFVPPHDHGSSHGDTRITRQAIGEGREFVPLALRSHQIWEELEAATGQNLLVRNGCLILASPNTPGNHHGSTSFVEDTIAAAREFGIAHEMLPAAEIRRRYPQFRLRGDEVGYFEPGAGFVRPEACIEAQLILAREAGAQMVTGEVVLDIKATPSQTVEVVTDRNQYVAARVIIAAGAWLPKLLDPDLAPYFRIHRQVLCWFPLSGHRDRYTPGRFPVFIWIAGNRPRDMMYGFPAVDGAVDGVKIATEQYDQTTDPDEVSRSVDASEITALYAEYIAPRFPDVSGNAVRTSTCLYTVTPDAKFIIDHVHDNDNVLFVSACSGHGFKHSAAIGESLAQQLLGQKPRVDLSPFSWQRFGQI